ncbi:c-type cytochrome [Thiohalorhabdus sp.]|uniref:c-type cytochrome n=1 Tax=Thiohalorhabdus sp. TaxID=3094134 RepID=UPI002FC2B16F
MDHRFSYFRKPVNALLLLVLLILTGLVLSEARAQSMAKAAKGQKIFFKVCVQCHTLQEKDQLSGPGLAGVLDRVPSEEWLMNYLENPEGMLENGNAYAQQISGDYPLGMPRLKVMQDASNREAVLAFLKQMRQQNMASQ